MGNAGFFLPNSNHENIFVFPEAFYQLLILYIKQSLFNSMKLPYGNQVDQQQIIDKLTTYSLNFDHKEGKHKAGLFKDKLGILLENQEIILTALRQAAINEELIYQTTSEYRNKYVIDFNLTTEVGTSIIRSCWIIRLTEVYPRLITVYQSIKENEEDSSNSTT
ncbi:hypothetical protein PCC7424_4540 [Gloeothece citriformis PCC 7424]|uniref:DUF6883 domain-containing protein n=1 Tax=Gloeothece citriformis (strain PCC 7424) TaxID=65393 RepID=B7KAC9_GLOC7|nr:DUF6883 domain-containing protein [Gloeothece citriformis]ACK72903.1 hypothetical protein PCC7424_4540 [Gloeothece citriformis PCC 7424]